MKQLTRYRVHTVLAVLIALPLILPACILVVEEDRDRRHLGGTEWYLEIVFYRTQTLSATDREIQLAFKDDTQFEGRSNCGPFSGTYRIDDEDAVSIDSFEPSQGACEPSQTSALFLNQLIRAKTLNVDKEVLRINTEGSNYLQFNGE